MGYINIFGLVGITLIFTSASIFKPLRGLLKKWPLIYNYITCSMCIGFPIGLLYGLLIVEKSIIYSILLGGSVSLISYFLDQLITVCELEIFINGGKEITRDKGIERNFESIQESIPESFVSEKELQQTLPKLEKEN